MSHINNSYRNHLLPLKVEFPIWYNFLQNEQDIGKYKINRYIPYDLFEQSTNMNTFQQSK